MKLTTNILAITLTITAGAAWSTRAAAQNVDAIDNARSVAKSLEQKQETQTNQALDAAGVPGGKPAAGAPVPAVKPAVIPGSNPVAPAPAAAKTAAPQVTTAADSGASNRLQKVNVVQNADNVQIEMISSEAVTGKVSKLNSPARVLVELPGTIAATPHNRIEVSSAGVKGVRIGTNGKTPPTTSIVVDLEKACAYELTAGPEGKLVLTLHTDTVARDASTSAAKTAAAPAPKPAPVVAKNTPKQAPIVAKNTPAPAVTKPVPAPKPSTSAAKTAVAAKTITAKAIPAKPSETPASTAKPAETMAGMSSLAKPEEPKPEDKKWAMTGKRDPFFSPVVQQSGSGCTTGKKCLEIGNINLRGVVKSDSGFIAVVTNNLNKAYFLRENDPVFNGFVVKITGDSVVFQETVEDKLGKPFTREVVKRIFTPAV